MFEKWEHFESLQKWPLKKGYILFLLVSLTKNLKFPKLSKNDFISTLQLFSAKSGSKKQLKHKCAFMNLFCYVLSFCHTLLYSFSFFVAVFFFASCDSASLRLKWQKFKYNTKNNRYESYLMQALLRLKLHDTQGETNGTLHKWRSSLFHLEFSYWGFIPFFR